VAKRSLSKRDLELAKLRHGTIRFVVDGCFGIFKAVIRGATWIGIAVFFYFSCKVLAGTNTNVSADLKAVINVGLDRWVMGIATILSGAGYANQRRIRRKTTDNRVEYIRELEKRIDPGRTSSKLDTKGRPPRGDSNAA
jgi:hypothetical protein